jgi:predicted outer membrane protein
MQTAPEELGRIVTYLQNVAPITLATLQAVAAASDTSAQQQQAVTVPVTANGNTGDHNADTITLELLCAKALSTTT